MGYKPFFEDKSEQHDKWIEQQASFDVQLLSSLLETKGLNI